MTNKNDIWARSMVAKRYGIILNDVLRGKQSYRFSSQKVFRPIFECLLFLQYIQGIKYSYPFY